MFTVTVKYSSIVHIHCTNRIMIMLIQFITDYTTIELIYVNGFISILCLMQQSPCQLLWCRIGAGKCTTNGHPPADGTECWLPGRSAQGRCYRGSCMSKNNTALQPAHGGWSQWSAWSACSWSCGTGVAASHRNCSSPAWVETFI